MQHDILDEPIKASNFTEAPTPIEIRILCALGFLGSGFVFVFGLLFGSSTEHSLFAIIPSLLAFGLFPIIAFVGIWNMKRNYVYFYYFVQLLKFVVCLIDGSVDWGTLFLYAFPAFVSIAVFSHWHKMT